MERGHGPVPQHEGPDQPRQRIDPWSPVALPPGARLDIHTCGGAGWGFPGYGDIEWDPREWFGSSDAG